MDQLPLVRSMVAHLAAHLPVPVSCKIRMFPDLEDTLAYARMLEEAGCSLLAVHGRTREQKNGRAIRADWAVIKAVKDAVRIPVLANGNVRWREDAEECMRLTGVDGVMSAESLLANPALFGGHRMPGEDTGRSEVGEGQVAGGGAPSRGSENGAFQGSEQGDKEGYLRGEGGGVGGGGASDPDQVSLMLEYLELCEQYPVPMRMVRAHVHRQLGCWFRVHKDLRERLNKESRITIEWLKELVRDLGKRIKADPLVRPIMDAPERGGGGKSGKEEGSHRENGQEEGQRGVVVSGETGIGAPVCC